MLTLLALAAAASPALVHADALNVRQHPGEGAAVVARLAIHTPVDVLSTRDGWAQIALPGRPAAHPLTGWVQSGFLGDHPLDRAALWSATATGLVADRLRAAERLVALEPDADALATLAALAREAGQPDRADAVDRWAQGDRPVWLAVCGGGRAMLRARLDADGWTPAQAMEGHADAVLADARTAGSQRWWYVGAEHWPAQGVPQPTPFPAPFLTPATNEDGASPWIPGTSSIDDGTRNVVLGACEQSGWLATVPLRLAEPALVDTATVWSSAAALASALDEPVAGGAVVEPVPGLREVRLRVPFEWRSCGGDGHAGLADVFALVDADGEPVAGWHELDGRPFMRRVDTAQWFTAEQGAEPFHIGVYGSAGGTWSQDVLIGVRRDGVHEALVVTEQWGC